METNDPKHQISIITSSSSSSPHPPISSTSNRNLNLNLNQGFDGVEKESSGDLALYGNVPQSAIPTPPPVPPRALFMQGDVTQRFAGWLESVRKRSGQNRRSSGFPNRLPKQESLEFSLLSINQQHAGQLVADPVDSSSFEQAREISLWERLGKAAMLDIESSEFSWCSLSSLHHTEHSSTEHSEDEMNKAVEVTVNSGGVVFFALFNKPENDGVLQKEAAAVIKISSSRMSTQSERLGYELAKWLGVQTPQARVVHNSSPEWQQIKDAAEKAREVAVSEGDDGGEMTCLELLEALEMSRCLLLMNYIHGSPLQDSPNAFESQEAAEKTAAALGRILMLDLIIRNEDRLACRQLGWRGNPSNLIFVDECPYENASEDAFDSAVRRCTPGVISALRKERRSSSVDGKLGSHKPKLKYDATDSQIDTKITSKNQEPSKSKSGNFYIVAIDSGVPRRPPTGKRANDQTHYPKLVELLLNSAQYSSNLLHEITGGKMGAPVSKEVASKCFSNATTIVQAFQGGFRSALRDLQGFYIFILTLHQKLDNHLRAFLSIINRSSTDFDKEDTGTSESLSQPPGFSLNLPSPARGMGETQADLSNSEMLKTVSRLSSLGRREGLDSFSPRSRENCHGRFSKGSGEPHRSLRLTLKLRDFNKFAKVDAELNRELDQWNEMLRTDAVKLCTENNFNAGFFEGSDNNIVVDAYELKVRLEHILERIALILDAANTERPSMITGNLFIGGALSARSVFTLQQLGITHILCLCSNEIGQSDSQFPDLFEYKNFSQILDNNDANISNLFKEASDFIKQVELSGRKILVHCFEGKSRSATVVLAYMMLRKNFTLLEAWNTLKKVHRRAQPNDGFAKTLLDLDIKLHGKPSMEWQQRKPAMKLCRSVGRTQVNEV
ncbi:hypothetical protein AAC387_Pa09g0319 [Persea americana]